MRALNNAGARATRILGLAVAAGVIGSIGFAAPAAAQAPTKAQLQESWRATIARTPTPGSGCYQASYPLTVWKQVQCSVAPARPYVPASGHGSAQTTGDGNDYSAVVTGLMSSTVGTFPKVKGVTSETDGGRANSYSLQVNSNFMSGSPACASANVPANCLAWEQFVYSSTEQLVFMQYWLIHYSGGSVHCPSGWNVFSDDCYKNSAAVHAPNQTIDQLQFLQVSGTAVASGIDTLVFTTKTNAYSTTGPDSVVFLANGWNASEFNIIGDGGGSEANFNAGSKVTVRVAVTNGTTNAPVCQADDGTTGETNNLNLKACKVKGGALPYAQFKEVLKN